MLNAALAPKTDTPPRTAPAMVEQPVYTSMGDYAGTEWVPASDPPPMSYGEQMRHVGQVGLGFGKGVVNGVPVLATEIAKGWLYIGAGINDMVDALTGGPGGMLDRYVNEIGPVTGAVLPYNNVEERLGGFGGEFLSPNAYATAGRAAFKGAGVLASAAADTLYAFSDAYLYRSGLVSHVVPPTRSMPSMRGPVELVVPVGATAEEIAQLERYAAMSNEAIQARALSSTGRVSTTGVLRQEASRAAALEKARAQAASAPYTGHAGHVPDTTWTGAPQPYGWLDLSPRLNMSLGGQTNRYPIGFQPTEFVVVYPSR